MGKLSGKTALVAGATRGAGRGVARVLGEAGATVYCTGRSTREHPASTGPFAGRKETIEETAEMVEAGGGVGIPVRVDHAVDSELADLFLRIREEQGRLDVLVNDFWGGPSVTEWGEFWKHEPATARALFDAAWPHVLTSRHAAAMMVEKGEGLIVQMTEADALYYRMNLYYDLARVSEVRLAYAMAEELREHGVTALALTPGYLRAEATLGLHGVTEANWRDAIEKDPSFAASETPFFVGRAVLALAADPDVRSKSGGLYSSWGLAEEYGFTDVDGSQPNLGRHLASTFGETPYGPPRTAFRWKLVRAEPN